MTMTVGVYLPWRYLALLAAALLVVSMVGTLLLPDSPRWLLLNNRRSEAKEALCTLRGVHVDIQPELVEMEQSVRASVSASFTLSHLRDRGYYKPALLSLLVTFIQQASGSNILLSYLQARSHGGARGAQPPWKNLSPPRLRCPFCRNYRCRGLSPPGILSAPPPANDTWLRRCLPGYHPETRRVERHYRADYFCGHLTIHCWPCVDLCDC